MHRESTGRRTAHGRPYGYGTFQGRMQKFRLLYKMWRLTYERRMPIKLTNYNCAAAFETSHGPRPAT